MNTSRSLLRRKEPLKKPSDAESKKNRGRLMKRRGKRRKSEKGRGNVRLQGLQSRRLKAHT